MSEHLDTAQAHALFDESKDGAEVFSLMRTSQLAPTAYLDRFFKTGHERMGHLGEMSTERN